MEIFALEDKDGSSSIGDLERELNRNSVDTQEREECCASVSTELNFRSKGAADGYPFTFSGSLLKQKEDLTKHTPYIFCLFLSYFDGAKKKYKHIYPDRIFEHIARIAARNYLDGEAVRFGWPRVPDEIPSKFTPAVKKLCEHLGEVSHNGKKSGRAKDDELDVVAWKHFPDKRSGKIILWGQCAAGWDWEDKLTFDPEAFRLRWVQPGFANPLLKSIFIPHTVNSADWDYFAAAAKILFDRCRIASYSFDKAEVELHTGNMKIWCEWMLKNSK